MLATATTDFKGYQEQDYSFYPFALNLKHLEYLVSQQRFGETLHTCKVLGVDDVQNNSKPF